MLSITDVSISPVPCPPDGRDAPTTPGCNVPGHDATAPGGRLLAYASFLICGVFRITDVRIIAARDRLIVAMPSRKLSDRCRHCDVRVALNARFCPNCGARHPRGLAPVGTTGRPVYHADVAYPVTAEARAAIERAVLVAYGVAMRAAGTAGTGGGDEGRDGGDGAMGVTANGTAGEAGGLARVGVLPVRRRA
jgi:stage V sporulation protein G